MDQVILESSPSRAQQVRRCIGIGLLCVQQVADDRPKMSAVVAMLENEALEVPNPKPPGFFADGQSEIPSSSRRECSTTVGSTYQYTVSEVEPR